MNLFRRQLYIGLAATMLLVTGAVAVFWQIETNRGESAHLFPETPGVPGAPKTYEWIFEEHNDATDYHASRTSVSLVLDGLPFNLGDYKGKCFEIDGWKPPYFTGDEIIAAQCWSDTEGDEFGVFRKGEVLNIAHAELMKTYPERRVNFQTLFLYP